MSITSMGYTHKDHNEQKIILHTSTFHFNFSPEVSYKESRMVRLGFARIRVRQPIGLG